MQSVAVSGVLNQVDIFGGRMGGVCCCIAWLYGHGAHRGLRCKVCNVDCVV